GEWTPVSTADWINVINIPGSMGPGPGSVTYSVAKNTGTWRSGTIIVGGQQFHVYQNPVDCPADLICRFFPSACGITGKNTGLMDVSHSFRDRILARSDRGRRYTSLYYQFSREAVRIMLSNPMLLLRSRDMLSRYKPVLDTIVHGQPVSLTQEDLDNLDEFLEDFSRTGSGELREALGGLRQDLKDPTVHAEFKISISAGPKRETGAAIPYVPAMLRAIPWTLIGGFGFIFGELVRRKSALLLKAGSRSLPILLFAVPLCGSAPLHARHPNPPGPAAASPALSNLSYLGGSGDDQATAIATDSTGNVYVAGFTTSSNFPTAAAA